MVEYNGIIHIQLIGAEGLPPKDLMGTSDPYFIFKIGNQKIQSKFVKKSLSPYYGKQELMLCISKTNEALIVQCFDANNVLKDYFIGDAIYLIDECVNSTGKYHFVQLKLYNQKKDAGSVDFNIKYELFHH